MRKLRGMYVQVSDLEGGVRGCHNDAEPSDLPPGAVMRGRDPLMDHLMSSKLSQELPEGFSRTTSCEMATPGGPGGYSVTQSPMGVHSSVQLYSLRCMLILSCSWHASLLFANHTRCVCNSGTARPPTGIRTSLCIA